MTLADLWDWMVSPTYKDDEEDPKNKKKNAKGQLNIDPGIKLQFQGMETNPLAPTYTPPSQRAQPMQVQRRGTVPKPSMKYWDAMLDDLNTPDKGSKF